MTPTEAKAQATRDLYLLLDRPWREIDEATYTWLENCAPSAAMTSYGFVNGEAQVDDEEGSTYYITCRNTVPDDNGTRYWLRLSTIKEFRQSYGLAAPLPPAPAKMVGVLLAG